VLKDAATVITVDVVHTCVCEVNEIPVAGLRCSLVGSELYGLRDGSAGDQFAIYRHRGGKNKPHRNPRGDGQRRIAPNGYGSI